MKRLILQVSKDTLLGNIKYLLNCSKKRAQMNQGLQECSELPPPSIFIYIMPDCDTHTHTQNDILVLNYYLHDL